MMSNQMHVRQLNELIAFKNRVEPMLPELEAMLRERAESSKSGATQEADSAVNALTQASARTTDAQGAVTATDQSMENPVSPKAEDTARPMRDRQRDPR